ncbi:MAG: hypothetical protein M3Y13_08535 [Armatimonadota bacterium]|nr:hypothetical protein [Armatimonadota bacterium]
MANVGRHSWNKRNGLLALRRNANREELSAQVAELRSVLSDNPADVGARYMLANSRYGLSLVRAARTEGERVMLSGSSDWAEFAATALSDLKITDALVSDRWE